MSMRVDLEMWKGFSNLLKRKEIKEFSQLLIEGQIAQEAFIIEKGCLRCYSNSDQDITFQFLFENELFFSIESFLNNKPNSFSLESIEPCIIHSISKNNFNKIIRSSKTLQKQIDNLTFETMIYYENLLSLRSIAEPESRYVRLMTTDPQIIHRIPNYYVASYLGIDPSSLIEIMIKMDLPKNLN